MALVAFAGAQRDQLVELGLDRKALDKMVEQVPTFRAENLDPFDFGP